MEAGCAYNITENGEEDGKLESPASTPSQGVSIQMFENTVQAAFNSRNANLPTLSSTHPFHPSGNLRRQVTCLNDLPEFTPHLKQVQRDWEGCFPMLILGCIY